jgi:hypothetical protein
MMDLFYFTNLNIVTAQSYACFHQTYQVPESIDNIFNNLYDNDYGIHFPSHCDPPDEYFIHFKSLFFISTIHLVLRIYLPSCLLSSRPSYLLSFVFNNLYDNDYGIHFPSHCDPPDEYFIHFKSLFFISTFLSSFVSIVLRVYFPLVLHIYFPSI